MNEKIIKNIMWGVSAIVGIVIAEKIYDAGIKAIEKEDKESVIEIPFDIDDIE